MKGIRAQGRRGLGVLLASQFLPHFQARDTDDSEPLLTWFVYNVPNVTPRKLDTNRA